MEKLPKDVKIISIFHSFYDDITSYRAPEEVEEFFNPQLAFKEVHIASIGDIYDYSNIKYKTLKIHPIRPLPGIFKIFWIISKLYYIYKTSQVIDKLIKKYDIDLALHTTGTPFNHALPIVMAAKKNKKPSIVTLLNDYDMMYKVEHPLFYSFGFIDILMKYIMKNSSIVRVVAKDTVNYALRKGIDRNKIIYLPRKENIDKFQDKPPQDEIEKVKEEFGLKKILWDNIVILTVSKLYKQKNIERMILAFKKSLDKCDNIIFLIVGRGPLEDKLKKLIEKNKITNKVFFIDFVPHKKLRCIYHFSDIFLFPTLFEGRPKAVFEALLSNLPVICSNYGEVTEMVKNNEDGIWVDPYNVDEISKAIIKLCKDEKLRKRLSTHSLLDKEEYSIENVNKKEISLYMDVVNRHSS